ncbi:MAG: phosphate ABC transporter substrate-binding protein [Eubacteriales bacterium]|nr:phosphate ABC transporter substrate-binding protein [Eubacteriales bacterium]
MRKKMISLFAAGILAAGTLAGCGSTANTGAQTSSAPAASEAGSTAADAADSQAASTADSSEAAGSEAADQYADLSGSITMSGSTSMEKLANALAESFMAKYPGVTVTAEFTGSSAGIESVLAGSVDIGNSSRNLKEDEKSAGAVENIVAIDGIAVVTDPANTVTDLTTDQLISIYKGETKNWSELGGADQAIVVVGREAGSGTRGAFEEILGIEDQAAYANELDSTGAVMAKVASTPGAIGYVSLDVVDDTVLTEKLDGVEATEENIKNGSYTLSRPFVMATKGEISEQKPEVQALFDYLSSDEGKELIKSVGLITVD